MFVVRDLVCEGGDCQWFGGSGRWDSGELQGEVWDDLVGCGAGNSGVKGVGSLFWFQVVRGDFGVDLVVE